MLTLLSGKRLIATRSSVVNGRRYVGFVHLVRVQVTFLRINGLFQVGSRRLDIGSLGIFVVVGRREEVRTVSQDKLRASLGTFGFASFHGTRSSFLRGYNS